MVFTLTSQMYHRISELVPVLVRVPEYLSTSTSTSTMTFELTSTSTRNSVLEYCEYEYKYPSPGTNIFYQENAFENIVWKNGGQLGQVWCVNNVIYLVLLEFLSFSFLLPDLIDLGQFFLECPDPAFWFCESPSSSYRYRYLCRLGLRDGDVLDYLADLFLRHVRPAAEMGDNQIGIFHNMTTCSYYMVNFPWNTHNRHS